MATIAADHGPIEAAGTFARRARSGLEARSA